MSGSVLGTSPRAAVAGSHGPFSYVAALAWCPTVCRGTDDCGEHLPSTAACLAHPWLGEVLPAAPGKTPCQARGKHPVCAEGWALWAFGGSPYLFRSYWGYLPVGDALRWGGASRAGLLLGRLGGDSVVRFSLSAVACRRRPGESTRGESRCGPQQVRLVRTSRRGRAGKTPADPATL